MPKLSAIEHAVLLAYLAEYQDELGEAADRAIAEYHAAQDENRPADVRSEALQRMRDAIDLRDAMGKARKYVGGAK